MVALKTGKRLSDGNQQIVHCTDYSGLMRQPDFIAGFDDYHAGRKPKEQWELADPLHVHLYETGRLFAAAWGKKPWLIGQRGVKLEAQHLLWHCVATGVIPAKDSKTGKLIRFAG